MEQFLLDSIEVVTKKIMSAKTDSLNSVKFDVVNQPGVSNLLTIYSSLENISIHELENKFKNQDYGIFKKELIKVVSEFLTSFQSRYNASLDGFEKIENDIFNISKQCANLANNKLNIIKKKVGLA